VRLSNLVKIGVGLWLLHWAAQELAAYAGRHWERQGLAPRDSPRRPGWMPGPPEETLRRSE
jgi:hypothetical protein